MANAKPEERVFLLQVCKKWRAVCDFLEIVDGQGYVCRASHCKEMKDLCAIYYEYIVSEIG